MKTLQRQAATPVTDAPPGSGRIMYVEALRVLLIMLVVAHHSVEAYVGTHPAEIPLPDPPIPRAWVFLWVNAGFFMGLFFFLAGYFTPGAFDRKGPAAFLADRCLRLGLPLLLGTLAIVPLQGWSHLALNPAMPPVGYWTYLTQDFLGIGPKPSFWPNDARWPALNFGHLWFLEHLLIYGLLYAALRMLMVPDRAAMICNPPSHGIIAGYAVLLAATSFVIRISYPQDRWIGFLGFIQMEPAHIAQYASLFAIGLFAGRNHWLERMPRQRGLVWLAIGSALAVAAFILVGSGTIQDFNSRAWWVCTWEAFLCVGLCLGLPVLFRELTFGTGRSWQSLAVNAYAVYVFHFPIVLLLQWALIEVPIAKWVRLVVTVIGAILGSFAFTNWIILRLPYARRVF